MLAGVPYKKEYDKVIPKAETHKEIQQPPNIGTRRITRMRKEKDKLMKQLVKEKDKQIKNNTSHHLVVLHWRQILTKTPLKEVLTKKN